MTFTNIYGKCAMRSESIEMTGISHVIYCKAKKCTRLTCKCKTGTCCDFLLKLNTC